MLNASNYDTAYVSLLLFFRIFYPLIHLLQFEINSLKVYSNGSSSGSSSDSSSSSAPSTHGFSALGWLLAGVIGVSALAGMM